MTGRDEGRAAYKGSVSGEKHFGLDGAPEVRYAQRVRVDAGALDALMLALASFTTVPLVFLKLSEGITLPSVVTGLSLLVVLWGWWTWFAKRRTGTNFRGLGFMIYVLAFTLRAAGELLGNMQAGVPLNPLNALVFALGACASVYFAYVLRFRPK